MDSKSPHRPSLFVWDPKQVGQRPGESKFKPEDESLVAAREADKLKALTEQAYAQGLESGRLEGLRLGQNSFNDRLKRLDDLERSFSASIANLRQDLQPVVSKLALKMATLLWRQQLTLMPEHIAPIVDECLALLGEQAKNIRVRIHPNDKAYITIAYELILDDKLAPGGCIIETEFARIDASLETQLKQFMATQSL